MKKIYGAKNRILPEEFVLPYLAAFGLNGILYFGTGRIPREHYLDMSTPLDGKLPFCAPMIFVYFGSYLFWMALYLWILRMDRVRGRRLVTADFLGKLLCLFCFLLLPATLERQEVLGDGLFERMVAFLYAADRPTNLFPSIHCMMSWFCFLGVRGRREVSAAAKAGVFAAAALICVSTVTLRQHVLADVAAGILGAELCWFAAGRRGLRRHAARLYAAIWRRMGGGGV